MRTIQQPFFSTWTQPWTDLWSKYIVKQIKEDEYKTFDDLDGLSTVEHISIKIRNKK